MIQLALLGLLLGLIGLGAIMLWTIIRWLRLRMEARSRPASRPRAKVSQEGSAWVQAGRRMGGDPTPTPWPSISNPNLADPVARMIEKDDDLDDSLEETQPMHPDSDPDDTEDSDTTNNGLHDTDEEHRWEFEGEEDQDELNDTDDDDGTEFGDDSIGFDGDGTDDPDDTDDPDRPERW